MGSYSCLSYLSRLMMLCNRTNKFEGLKNFVVSFPLILYMTESESDSFFLFFLEKLMYSTNLMENKFAKDDHV